MFCVKIGYVAQIEAAGLSSKEKSVWHSIGRNFDPIDFKLVAHTGLIKSQIKFVNELCGANRRGKTFLEKNVIIGKPADIRVLTHVYIYIYTFFSTFHAHFMCLLIIHTFCESLVKIYFVNHKCR